MNREEFIEKALKIHPEYNYDKVIYINSKEKVILTCYKHGDFPISPSKLLYAHQGCRKCGIEKNADTRRLSNEKFIEKAIKVHPEYNYDKVQYTNTHTDVIVICKEHGEFPINPSNLLAGKGCKKCGHQKRANKQRLTRTEFIEKAISVHPEYNYDKVQYTNIHTDVIVICKEHGEFQISPNNLLRGQGCRKCGFESSSRKQALTQEEFIERARRFHPEYNYAKVEYKNNRTDVIIECPVHGDFPIRPSSILNGCGCQKCGNDIVISQTKLTEDEFIRRCKVHHNEYDYTKVHYVNNHTRVDVGCPKHGFFKGIPHLLMSGSGCNSCGNERIAELQRLTTTEFIDKAINIFPDYIYDKVKYFDSKTRVCITCKEHGDFFQVPNYLLNGAGCPFCSPKSNGEVRIEKWLNSNGFNVTQENHPKRFPDLKDKNLLSYDFYIEEKNILIEFNGEQHYRPIEHFGGEKRFNLQVKHDKMKRAYAKNNGYKFLEISYKQFEKIEEILAINLL